MQKRAQVTIYLIVGLVIFVIIALFIYLKSDFLESILSIEKEKAILMPEQIKPIEGYIDQCLKSVSEEGLLCLVRVTL